jgi:hypothetical protein
MTVASDLNLASGIMTVVAAVFLVVIDHAVTSWMRAFLLLTGHSSLS